MSERAPIPDRRTFPRFTGNDLQVTIRLRGRLSRMRGVVLDFNRYGVAVLVTQPLPDTSKSPDKPDVFVSLSLGLEKVDNVIGVVHTCSPREGGFRCGIQFRTQSKLQQDKAQVEKGLMLLEMEFAAGGPAAEGPSVESSAAH